MKINLQCHPSKYEVIEQKLKNYGFVITEDTDWLLIDTTFKIKRIRIKTSEGMILIDNDHLIALESFDHIIHIHTLMKSFDVRKPLKEIETDLPEDFLRISRSVIINKNHIKHIKTLTGQKFNIQTTKDMKFIVTKLYHKMFIEKMDL